MRYEVVYLDRDGTINIDRHYLSDPAGFEFCPGALAGLQKFAALGMDLVVITNQSGIARGYFSLDQLEQLHMHMCDRLADEGLALAGIYACPHGPDDGCDCRKPKPGLIRQAEAQLGCRPGIMIGDATRDVEAGQLAGLTTIGLFDQTTALTMVRPPDHLAANLLDAANWVCEEEL